MSTEEAGRGRLGRRTLADSLEWIARITSHIPRKSSRQVIDYGSYSHGWRGRERRQGISTTERPLLPLEGR